MEAADILAANIREFMRGHVSITAVDHLKREGISPPTVRTYLKGNTGATLDVIAQIAAALGKKPWQMLCKDTNAVILSEATDEQLAEELRRRMKRGRDNG